MKRRENIAIPVTEPTVREGDCRGGLGIGGGGDRSSRKEALVLVGSVGAR